MCTSHSHAQRHANRPHSSYMSDHLLSSFFSLRPQHTRSSNSMGHDGNAGSRDRCDAWYNSSHHSPEFGTNVCQAYLRSGHCPFWVGQSSSATFDPYIYTSSTHVGSLQ